MSILYHCLELIVNSEVGSYSTPEVVGYSLTKTSDGLEFNDWYLDVWQPVGSKPELLDEDELNKAVKAGYLTKKDAIKARDTANQLIKELNNNTPDF